MSDWNTGVADLSIEDTDQTSSKPRTDESARPGNLEHITDDQIKERAAAHGWVKPTGYEYERYVRAQEEPPQGRNTGTEGFSANAPAANFTSDLNDWGSSAAKYEWKEDYGDVAPAFPELEEKLFRSEYINRKGAHLEALKFEVTVESETRCTPIKRFLDAGLHPVMLENIKLCGYTDPTPVQAYCIPAILQNKDIIAVAQTGSGKTAAFMIPILSKLMGKASKLCAPRPSALNYHDPKRDWVLAEPLVLIIVPTRELAVQIFDEARRLCYRSKLRPCVMYGGAPVRDQQDELGRGCDILIGTLGRLRDVLSRGNRLSLRRVRYTVIDEADEMVTDDWRDEMKSVMEGGDNNEDADHKYMLFSATFPKQARALAREYLEDDHIRIRVGRAGSTHSNIAQKVLYCDEGKKRECLRDLLMAAPPARTIVFVNSKRNADLVDDYLYNSGMPSTSIHGDRTQREREDAIRAFKNASAPILITTGVSARGLDIVNVMHVINYDLPSSDHGGINEYIHRIGRTARIGQTGIASSFYNDRNEDLGPALVKILVECRQPVPDFLQQFAPEAGAEIDFEDDSDEEGADTGEATGSGGGGWGADGDAPAEEPAGW